MKRGVVEGRSILLGQGWEGEGWIVIGNDCGGVGLCVGKEKVLVVERRGSKR